MKYRVVIADDEPLARKRLRQLLDDEPGIEVIAECADGLEAVQVIRKKSPDIVLLDIRMPELDGFGVLEKLKGVPLPAFIFVTAYDRFAARAFDIEAVDYILKPFTRERLRTAISRAMRSRAAWAKSVRQCTTADSAGFFASRDAALRLRCFPGRTALAAACAAARL